MKIFYNEQNKVTLIYYAELPNELKDKNYLEVEELPVAEEKQGFNPVLKCDGSKVWYEYEEKELTELDKVKIELKATNKALSELMLLNTGMMGGDL